jgi:hypothetical protein
MAEFVRLEHPGQIQTRYSWAEKRRHDYAGGTLEAPTVLYLMEPGGTTLGPALIVEPWPLADPAHREAVRVARSLIRGDEHHREFCGRGPAREWERRSCGTCALLGWAPVDPDWPVGWPNYAGWARVYVEAGEPIPRAWLAAFVDELNESENERYREALRRDVATFGYRLTDERPGYRLRAPTADSVRAWLEDYNAGDSEFVLAEALAGIADDEGYDRASRRAARAALRGVAA